MAATYIWNMNPVQDILINMLLSNVDISDSDSLEEIHGVISNFFEPYMKNAGDLVHLDFNIIRKNEYYKVIGNNFITSLWFIGIIPDNSNMVMQNNKYKFDNKIYTFNNKTKTLKFVTLNR
jgi:hypothetical protein